MRIQAVVPIKDLDNAKQRLAGLLPQNERKLLFQAMVEDVLSTLAACCQIEKVLVVTGDETVTELAEKHACVIMPEPEVPGLIPAMTAAGERLAEQRVDALLFLPGDVPMVTVAELETVLTEVAESNEPEFVIVPARDLGGSNCVVCSPPDCMRFGFGEDSFRRHLRYAKELGVSTRVIKLPGIGLDIDTPLDLGQLIDVLSTSATDSYTLNYLAESGILTRSLEATA